MLDQSNNLIRQITKVDHPTTRCYVSLNRETADFMVNNFNSINGNLIHILWLKKIVYSLK